MHTYRRIKHNTDREIHIQKYTHLGVGFEDETWRAIGGFQPDARSTEETEGSTFYYFCCASFFEEPRPKWDRERQGYIERPVVPAAKLESRIGEAGASCPVFEFRIELYRWTCVYVRKRYLLTPRQDRPLTNVGRSVSFRGIGIMREREGRNYVLD